MLNRGSSRSPKVRPRKSAAIREVRAIYLGEGLVYDARHREEPAHEAAGRGSQQFLWPGAYPVRYRARSRRGRGGGAARAQRRRQVDHVPLASLAWSRNRSGRIVFEGKDVSREPTHAIVRSGLGYVPEERRIFTDLTVEENLEVGRQPKRPNAPQWTREKLFTLFPNLGEMRNRPAGG